MLKRPALIVAQRLGYDPRPLRPGQPVRPSRLNEFNDWYDTYSAAITVPGYLANDIHFENPTPAASATARATRRSTTSSPPDPATAWPDTEHSPAYPTHLFSDPRARLVSPALRASYALVGSQLQPGQHGPLTGIHVILSNGGADTERQHREAQSESFRLAGTRKANGA